MEGGLVDSKVVALRLNSDVIKWEQRDNRVVKDKVPAAPGKKWVGLIQLFSAETGEPPARQCTRPAGPGEPPAREGEPPAGQDETE
jgi:hypothetical protein